LIVFWACAPALKTARLAAASRVRRMAFMAGGLRVGVGVRRPER
jgi:hypothetical protein